MEWWWSLLSLGMGGRSMVWQARYFAKSLKKIGRCITSMDMALMVTEKDFCARVKSMSILE